MEMLRPLHPLLLGLLQEERVLAFQGPIQRVVFGPEVIEGTPGGILGPRLGSGRRRVEEPGLRPAHLPGQLALLGQLLP